jgi:conjugative relaxase-like TrwC/TraI family protein
MSLHKLTAGDGYTYLTRQVAAHDGSERGYGSLGEYYAQKGESPGVWMGRGLVGLSDFPPGFMLPGFTAVDLPAGGHAVRAGQVVSEAQMVALFGEGRHPNAEQLEALMLAGGHSSPAILAATRLGTPFTVYEGASEFRRKVAAALVEYNLSIGAARVSPVPPEDRARIRTQVAETMFQHEYGRAPLDDRERAGFVARISRQATTAVAGYDLTFSPVKSVSALWAIAPVEISRLIEDAHRAAVADTLTWLEDTAAYTRLGRGGVRQVDVKGLIGAAFEHRDSRAGDPDLHTHLAISNKVQTLDGRWLALDGRTLHQMAVAASERYNTRLEAFLADRLPVTFAERPGTEAGKRAVREIVGIPLNLLMVWSARRAAIEDRRGELATTFQAEHGRPPSAVEAIHLAQQATLETRQGKHEPRSLGEQRTAWREQAINVLAGHAAFDALVARFTPGTGSPANRMSGLPQRWRRHTTAADVTPDPAWVSDTAARVVQIVQAQRATWREAHVRAEAERQIRAAALPLRVLDDVLEQVVAAALSPRHSIRLEQPDPVTPTVTAHVTPDRDPVTPDRHQAGSGTGLREPPPLRRRDGTSVYETAGTTLHTSTAVLSAERLLLNLAGRRGAPALTATQIDLALLESAANGLQLNPGQAELVRDLAGSGARLQLALAPAGTGKTTAMSVLARAWSDTGGHVLGLAPSAVAAAELRKAMPGAHTDTLAKLTHTLNAITMAATATATATESPRRHRHRQATSPRQPALRVPQWVQRIGPGTLVVIDEAGMAGTVELAHAVQALSDAGAVVRLIGDDQQLAAIGAGGVLRDIAHQHGALTLTHVVRFADPAEGGASLALRTGDSTAVGFYLDHDRIHVGDAATAVEQAYTAWRADLAAGRDAVLLAPTRELAAALNTRARADRLATATATAMAGAGGGGVAVDPVGPVVALSDGSSVSAGDTIITRHNDRRLPVTSTDWVKNGHRWHVEAITTDGGLRVRQLSTGRRIVLPSDYTREHVQLGYASTIHGAQGLTAATCHTVAGTGDLNRQLLYVAMSRGRVGNHLYLDVAGDGDEHTAITRDALLPPSAADELIRILGRDGAHVSATTTLRDLADPALLLQEACARYHDAVLAGAEHLLGAHGLERLDQQGERMLPGLSSAPSWPVLRSHLALISLDGDDPAKALRAAIDLRELDTAKDPAAVIDWRLDPTQRRSANPGPLPWQPGIPAALDADPVWGPYLRARAHLSADLAEQVAQASTGWRPATAPAWAVPLLGQDQLIGDLAIWRAAQAIAETDLHPPGPRPGHAAEIRHHQDLQSRVTALLGDPAAATTRWRPVIEPWAPHVLTDPFWPRLAAHLDTADRAGIDISALLTSVTADHRPLPDEHPASALWWRLSRTLTPAVLTGTTHQTTTPASGSDRPLPLRPPWTPCLDTVLASNAQRVRADAAWPVLVAVIDDAQHQGWAPEQLLSAAYDQLRTGSDDTALRPGELATGLTWCARSLLDGGGDLTTTLDLREPPPEDEQAPPEPDVLPPPDLHHRRRPRRPAPAPASATPAPAPAATARTVPAGVSAQRIADLNDAAMAYFTGCYPTSWAPAYLHERLGLTPPSDPERTAPDPTASTLAGVRVGYAPAGWTGLHAHLRSHGASDDELLAAGLVTRASTGRLIDRFRDRLIFPIHADLPDDPRPGRIIGFVGRQAPTADLATLDLLAWDRRTPKYLNTPTTSAFRKGEMLFGLTEATPALRAGAIPVLVEGPLDAIAITLAGAGHYVGLACLGTALTDAQADLLLAHTRPSPAAHPATEPPTARDPRHGLLVATDPDPAGQGAAERAYWAMAGRSRPDVGHVSLPAGADPAQILTGQGPAALRAMLDSATGLSARLIDARLIALADDLDTVEGRVQALRLAATVIGSQPPPSWPGAIDALSERLDLLPHTIQWEVAQAIHGWTEDPRSEARAAATTAFLPFAVPAVITPPQASSGTAAEDTRTRTPAPAPRNPGYRPAPPSPPRRSGPQRPR